MPRQLKIEQALQRGIAYLHTQQQADGGFLSYTSVSAHQFKPLRTLHTTFVPALILASLATIRLPEATTVREQLAHFLLKQKSPAGSFNYWAKNAPERQKLPYPDDLDDTFCTLIALYLHDPTLITEKGLAQSVKLLLATETKVGGPYRTWLVPPSSDQVWLDIDVAVNANVAYFLTLTGNSLPNLEKIMEEAIAAHDFSSPYYLSDYPFIYYFSRTYEGTQRARLLTVARRLHRAANLTALDNALCSAGRLRLHDSQSLEPAIKTLLNQQGADGSWPAAAFYVDSFKKGQHYYSGSAALTTAFACEALALYASYLQEQADKGLKLSPHSSHLKLASQLHSMAEADCKHLAPDFRASILERLARLTQGSEGEEIIGLPQSFSASLQHSIKMMPANFLRTLSLANLYGWLAYTIYDNFLDDSGQPKLLPIANVALRKSVDCFSEALPFHRPFQLLMREVFDAIDEANAWEVAHCRFICKDNSITLAALPDYGDLAPLAQRSLGHTLPLLAILLAAGIDDTGADFRLIRQALSHYLIARQLNDDIHDWEEDISKGHITYVVSQLLATNPDLKGQRGTVSLEEVKANLRKQFWYTSLPRFCNELRRQTGAARRILQPVTVLTPDNAIVRLLTGIEKTVDETLAKHKQAQAFLKHYRSSTTTS